MGMPAIALVLAAYQVTIFVEAGFFVLVTITFRGLASEGGFYRIAPGFLAMNVAFTFFLTADQRFSLIPFVALVGMLMYRFCFRDSPATFTMGVGLNYR